MSGYIASRHAEWLSLAEPTGGFLTVPVLNRAFPNGIDRLDAATRQEVRDRLPVDPRDQAQSTAWIEWVLGDLLGWKPRLRQGPQIADALSRVVGEHNVVLRADYALAEPQDGGPDRYRALVCRWPFGTNLHVKLPGDKWSAGPVERMSLLCRATGVPVGLVTDGSEWVVVWAPKEGAPGTARFLSSLFSEERTVLDAFVSILHLRRFFSVAADETVESLFVQSATAQEVVADQLGRQVRAAVELLIDAMSRSNRERDGELLRGHEPNEVYAAAVTVMMRMVFLLFAEERGLLPLDDELYSRSYALSTLRDALQSERDIAGDEPLERRSSAWTRLLALFRAVHGGITHEDLRIPPYGGRLFDPDRYPFLEGRPAGDTWRVGESHPIPVDDLSVLEILKKLQILEFREAGVREARLLSYRTLEVEQIGHVYEGLLDHSVRVVDDTTLGMIGKPGAEPEVRLVDVEGAAALGDDHLLGWLQEQTGLPRKRLEKDLAKQPTEAERKLLLVAVENDADLAERIEPYLGVLRRDLREQPVVFLRGSVVVTQTSARRDGGIEYTPRSLADEVAQYALEPLVYSPGPQDTAEKSAWRLRPSAELLELKICDPAVGSGAILVAAGRYLADRVVEAWVAEGAPEADAPAEEQVVIARRAVADRCLYGVDRDPLAAEMAKLSLWLTTMSKDRPFTFLDHAIRVGDALLGITELEQLRWMHLDVEAGKALHKGGLFDFTESLQPLIDDALERRRRLAGIRVVTIRDAEEKARLTAEADHDLAALRAVADLLVAAHVGTATQKKGALESRLQVALQRGTALVRGGLRAHDVAAIAAEASEWLNAGKPGEAPVRRCMHWTLEFPEVFLDGARQGFDVMVGNPPFIGGTKISGSMGSDVREHIIQTVASGMPGKADLVAYFFLRSRSVATSLGFLATNTVAQGDTSEVGLAQLIDVGWSISRAVPSIPWPGRASLEIAKVWMTSASWEGPRHLSDVPVFGSIDEMLHPVSRSGWRKQRLVSNMDIASHGSYVMGLGFTLTPEEAAALIRSDQRNAEVVRPYLGGEDVTQSPSLTPYRWIIDFRDWDENRARTYKDCFAIVRDRVRPERQLKDGSKYPKMVELWWRYWNERLELYRRIEPLMRAVAVARVSKMATPVFVQTGQVINEKVVVFSFDDDFHFGVLASNLHWLWVIRHTSTLGTGINYSQSDVFETFPRPDITKAVTKAGKALDDHRRPLMIEANEGLTKTYNRVHNPDDSTPGIVKLRELHVALDYAVRDAYGWTDLDLQHGFHPVRGQGIRYTFAPAVAEEILERLLELNKERYEAEVAAGLHGDAKGKKAPAKAKAKKAAGASLFDDEDGDDA